MGFGDKLKDIYFSAEESWYSFLDRIDSIIPVYKLVDRIDEVVPSFALFVCVILILLLLFLMTIGGGFFGFFNTQEAILKLSVVNNSGDGVSNAKVTIQGIDETYYSNSFGLLNDITVPFGNTINITAEKDNKRTTFPLRIIYSEMVEEIILNIESIQFSSKTLRFLSQQSNTLISDPLTLNYSCSDGENPPGKVIYDGTENVDVPSDCGQLTITITSEKFETKSVTITNAVTEIILNEIIPKEEGRAIIILQSNNETVQEAIDVMAYRADYSYIPEETVTSVNGTATFDLLEGDYIFKTRTSNGYLQGVTDIVTVVANDSVSETINLTKSVLGQISVEVKRGTTKVSDALVTLRKGNSEITNARTDSNGTVLFELGEAGPFIVIATKDGYCEDAKEANVGDNVILNLAIDNGNCGGELKVRVVDQDNKPIQYSKVIIFGENDEDSYKLSYADKLTDFNGKTSWTPIKYTTLGEKYKLFAYKGDYSGWSNAIEFNALNSGQEIIVQLELPLATVNVNVKDRYDEPIMFAEVQLFEEYGNTRITGKRIVENANGTITFQVKAGQRIYAVITKEGYESYMTIPQMVKGNNQINYNVVLARPPAEELEVIPLGLFKNDSQVLRAQPGEEYLAIFEVIAPKRYSELGFFARVGEENITKTELDRLYIKEIIAPGQKVFAGSGIDSRTGYGSSYNPPKGYMTDSQYTNLEESKWGQVVWTETGYAVGRIRLGVLIKIKENARMNEQLKIGYRVWGYDSGYERNPLDEQLGTTFSNSNKNALYALTQTQYIWIGTESLCETQGENSFCVTTTIEDQDGLVTTFDTSADVKNSSEYKLAIKVYNDSKRNFELSRIKLENSEENLFLKKYFLLTPRNAIIEGTINDYTTNWIDTGAYSDKTEISINRLEITPQKTGYAPLLLRIRDETSILFEKIFNFNVLSDKKMKTEYLFDNEYQNEIPKIVSGKKQALTIRVKNVTNNLEVNGARIKLYDRFGTNLLEKETNSIGIGTIEIPASMPGETLKIKIEKPDYETLEIELKISEDIVDITPTTLSFTVNPQTKQEDKKMVKVENKTGFELTIKEIVYVGKTKGLLSESQMESWFDSYKGLKINSNDYEEIEFKVVSSPIIPMADDIEGKFQIIVGNDFKTWVKEIDTKIRIGLGKDVDNADCLEVTVDNWTANTQGEEIEFALEIRNNCLVDGIPANLKNLGAKLEPTGNLAGSFSATTTGAFTNLSRGYTRIFKPNVSGQEIIPITLRFTPFGGTNGQITGTIIFEAMNKTDSKDQVLNKTINYTINIIDSSCLVIGADLVRIAEGETGSFSITNNCPIEASFQIESELALDNKIFNLKENESKDVTITRNEGDIPGAYNNLVYGRLGNQRQELIGNVKAILDDTKSCFTLTRYEFDVYDSPYNENDGMDRGYLRNECTQKNVAASVQGQKEFDWDKVIRDMIIGGLVGFMTSKEEGWLRKIFGSTIVDSLSGKNNKAMNEFKTRVTREQLSIKTQIEENKNKMNQYFENKKTYLAQEKERINAITNTEQECQTSKTKTLAKINQAETQVNARQQKMISEMDKIQQDFDKEVKKWQEKIDKLYDESSKKIIKNETSAQELEKKYYDEVTRVKNLLDEKVKEINKNITKIDTDNKKIEPIITETTRKITEYKQKCEIQSPSQQDNKAKKICDKAGGTLRDFIPGILIDSICSTYGEIEVTINTEERNILNENNKTCCKTPITQEEKKKIEVITPTPVETEGLLDVSPDSDDALKEGESIIYKREYVIKRVAEGNEFGVTKGYYVVQKISDTIDTSNILRTLGSAINLELAKDIVDKHLATNLISQEEIDRLKEKQEVGTNDPITPEETAPINIYGTQFTVTKVSSGQLQGMFIGRAEIPAGTYPNRTSETIIINESGITREELSQNLFEAYQRVEKLPAGTGGFLLASSTNSGWGGLGNIGGVIGNNLTGIAGGMLGGNMLYGALISGLTSILQGQDLDVEYSRSFAVPLVEIDNVSLQSEGGVSLSVGEPTFDYDDYYQSLMSSNNMAVSASNTIDYSPQGQTGTQSQGQIGTQGNQGFNFNQSAMSATIGLIEVRELIFTGGGQTTDTPYKPFTGVLTVSGTERIYENEYDYTDIEKSVKARGELKKDEQNWFLELLNPAEEPTAVMQEEDLIIKETRNYEKKFHLLFDSFEYIECGPRTYPCQTIEMSNCKVGSKTGITGPEAVPKMLLDWSWNAVNADTCDEANNNYVYCDVTQATISTLKKIDFMRNFFNNNTLSQCPSTIEAGTKTQDLSTHSIDVGITSIQLKETSTGARIETRVETNNNLELQAGIKYTLTRDSGEVVANTCDTTRKSVTSYLDYACELDKSEIGTGKFSIKAELDLKLCEGCENNVTTNDFIETTLLLGAEGSQTCEEYSTRSRSYFEKVLSANNILNSSEGRTALEYASFTINLMKDGYSEDFKTDFDNYLMQFATAPQEYIDNLRELFLKKFVLESPTTRNDWTAGKYKARLIIDFANDSWQWNDANDIEKITLKLEPWGYPDVPHAIYDVPFNGMVGIHSDNGRNGYGVNYNQLTEKPVMIVTSSGEGQTIRTEGDPASNPLTIVNTSVDESFYTMNSWNSGKRGNVLTISRKGNEIDLVLSPSIAVPTILNITRTNSLDAYAYYSVEVGGQPQNVGPSMITWTGIGQGCVDFSGTGMTSWDESFDSLNESGDGYGLRWNNTIAGGTASFYGVFYVPEQKNSVLIVNSAMESANFETTHGNGTTITIGSGNALSSIKDIFDAVKDESVCVAGGDYFWNNKQVVENSLKAQIDAKESTCISIS